MTTYSGAFTEIGRVVDEYILKKRLPQEDYFLYLQHACDCFRDINLRHTKDVIVTTKIAVSALGIIEMPSDMVGWVNLYVAKDGEVWSFTDRPKKVTTTTIVNNVETQDSTFGEGVAVHDDRYLGLGAKGGVNDYYRKVDWSARRIFCDGIKSDTAVLQYVSSGLVVGGSTMVPVQCKTAIDSYLDWQREIISPRSASMLQILEGYYKERILELRIVTFLPTRDEITDVWDAASSQDIMR